MESFEEILRKSQENQEQTEAKKLAKEEFSKVLKAKQPSSEEVRENKLAALRKDPRLAQTMDAIRRAHGPSEKPPEEGRE